MGSSNAETEMGLFQGFCMLEYSTLHLGLIGGDRYSALASRFQLPISQSPAYFSNQIFMAQAPRCGHDDSPGQVPIMDEFKKVLTVKLRDRGCISANRQTQGMVAEIIAIEKVMNIVIQAAKA